MKTAVIRKNHDEIGSCVECLWLNLYLNGDNFSWSYFSLI
jgi:hypothetical protein